MGSWERSPITDKIALLDLDGTVADYDGSMASHLARIASPGEDWAHTPYETWKDAPYMEARRKLIKTQPGFWRSLPRLDLGFDIVNCLREFGFLIHVLTKGPASSSNAWSEKVEWCREHLPDALVTITQDKSLSYGRILVDDFPPYFEKWLLVRPRGLVICVAHAWNQSVVDSRVIRYDGKNLYAVREAIRQAYERLPGS